MSEINAYFLLHSMAQWCAIIDKSRSPQNLSGMSSNYIGWDTPEIANQTFSETAVVSHLEILC